MKKLYIITTFILLSNWAMSQDPFFSQYSASPMTLNPALVGSNMQGLNRASFITRNQWWGGGSQPYITNTISFERNLSSKQSNPSNQLALGLMMLNERSNGGVLSNNYFAAALSDQVRLSEHGVLKAAISGTYSNRMLNLASATFQTQFGSFGFMSTASNYDPISATNSSFVELNTGLAFEHTTTDFDYEIGGAIFHASRPKQGVFNNTKYDMDPRGVGHASLKWRPNANGEFLLSGNVQVQAKKQLVTIGGAYTVNLHDEADHKLTVGVWDRVDESIYPYVALQVKTMKFGLSYDVVSTKVKSSFNSVSSVEASIVWDFGKVLK